MRDEELVRLLATRPADDDGFTERVMCRLPPARRPAPRALVVALAAAAGTLATALSPAWRWLGAACESVASAHDAATIAAPTTIVLVAIVVTLVGSSLQVASQES